MRTRSSAIVGVLLGLALSVSAAAGASWVKSRAGQHGYARAKASFPCVGGANGATYQSPVPAGSYADGSVLSNSGLTNWGSATTMEVSLSGTTSSNAYVKFPVAIPAHCTVQTAALILTTASGSGASTLTVQAVSTAWSENSFSGSGGQQPSVTGATATMTVANGGGVTVNCDVHLLAWASASANGFRIIFASGSGAIFGTKEGSVVHPKLVITWS